MYQRSSDVHTRLRRAWGICCPRPCRKSLKLFMVSGLLCVLTNGMYLSLRTRCQLPSFSDLMGTSLHRQRRHHGNSAPPLVTLFTTLKDVANRQQIHRNTLQNWAALPRVRLILFYDPEEGQSSDLMTLAEALGFTLLPVPEKSEHGVPRLKAMFAAVRNMDPTDTQHPLDAQTQHTAPPSGERSKSRDGAGNQQKKGRTGASNSSKWSNMVFIGYANGDILFDESLLKTTQAIQGLLEHKALDKALLVGLRYDYTVRRAGRTQHLHKPLHVSGLLQGDVKGDVTHHHGWGRANRHGSYDYFFLVNGNFVWDKVPDELVIGRPGYDPFIVGLGLQQGVPVIDCTRSLIALHQSGDDGNVAGYENKDWLYNNVVLNRTKDGLKVKGMGVQERLYLETAVTLTGEVTVVKKSYT